MTREEIKNCTEYLKSEIKFLKNAKVFVTLGRVAYETLISILEELYGIKINKKFLHQNIIKMEIGNRKIYIITSYHPSPRNVRTGRLKIEELVKIFERAKILVEEARQ